MISDDEFETVSQLSHIGWGALVIFMPIALFPVNIMTVGAIATSFTLLAATKEFVYDAKLEPVEVRGSNLKDFLYYCAGIYGAVALYAIKIFLWN